MCQCRHRHFDVKVVLGRIICAECHIDVTPPPANAKHMWHCGVCGYDEALVDGNDCLYCQSLSGMGK